MKDNGDINSDEYWNTRFAEDWEVFEGPRQSRFFANISIEHLPSWLMSLVKRESLTLADWGCAQGDGTNVWTNYIDAAQIVGIDFSPLAIEQATQRYPSIRFASEDWLSGTCQSEEKFDVVFSSNTLEHFHQAYDVLHAISQRAKKAVVLALPYKETERIDEHFFSFLPDNIPVTLPNGFRLVWSRVIDCRSIPDTLWNGDQIVLVYAEPNWAHRQILTLDDICIEQSDSKSERPELDRLVSVFDQYVKALDRPLAERKTKLDRLAEEMTSYSLPLRRFSEVLQALDAQIAQLARSLESRDRKIEDVERIRAAERRDTLRLSDWAHKMDRQPMRYAVKKHLRRVALGGFNALPISSGKKRQLKAGIAKTLREVLSLRRAFRSESAAELLSVDWVVPNPLNFEKLFSPEFASLEHGDALGTRDFFVFSVIDWHFRIQRPQHLARSLAKSGRRVFFFSNHFIDAAQPGYGIEKIDPQLELYLITLNVSGAPSIYFAPPTDAALAMIERDIAKLMIDFAVTSSVSVVQHAYWYPMVVHLPNSLRVYDCMDHHEGFGNVHEALAEIEKIMLRTADLVVVTSAWLDDFARGHNQSIALVRNAGEYEHFAHRPAECYQDIKGRKIVGYYGAIAEWFDLDLIGAIASARPDVLLLLVGNDTIQASKTLKGFGNIVFVGEVPYAQLPYYLHAFDVCLLPFKISSLTLATNPVKVYEYLAAGKPVVCVDLPEVAQFGPLVSCARGVDEFVAMVSDSLSLPDRGLEHQQRARFAQEQTWDHRASALTAAIKDITFPKISVVVLTYNNLDLTKSCLDSLLRWTDYPNLELIVEDNASSDATPDYLRELQGLYPSIKLLLNDKNLGFSAGNNVGLLAATGDYLVMLNNDTMVTPGWLLTLLRHFETDTSIGLIGPVTNNIGNQAKINISYSKREEMLPLSMVYTMTHMGRHFPLSTAAFFCVMMSREVFEKVGTLDENFGRGFFEDDDYCRRVEQLDLRVVCAEDVFVHHHLSASFDKLGKGEKQALFEQNKEYYESKWGKWEPHQHRDSLTFRIKSKSIIPGTFHE